MRPYNLNLRHLKAFTVVARRGSVSAASTAIHLSQPAITQAIAKLEATLRATLFARSNKGMIATDAGLLLLNRAERSLEFIRLGARQATRGSETRRGRGFSTLDQLVTMSQLRALMGVGDHGNFSLAARAVGISQPSLHRLARDLEQLSGVALFTKVPQGVELTQSGQILTRHFRLAVSELNQGLEELDALRGSDSARLCIGTLPLARTSLLPRAINALTRLRPDVQVRVVDGPYDDLLHGLRHGELDLLIGALRDPVPVHDVVQATLFRDHLVVVARRGHPLGGKRNLTVLDLAGYPWVVPRPGPPTRAHFDALFRDANIGTPPSLVESSSLILIRGLLLESDRLTLVSAHQVQHELGLGVLQRLSFDLPHTSRPIGTTVRRDWQPTTTQSLFLDLLRETSAQAVDTT